MAIGRTNASVGGGSQLKAIIDGRKNARYLFEKFSGTSVNNLISFSDGKWSFPNRANNS